MRRCFFLVSEMPTLRVLVKPYRAHSAPALWRRVQADEMSAERRSYCTLIHVAPFKKYKRNDQVPNDQVRPLDPEKRHKRSWVTPPHPSSFSPSGPRPGGITSQSGSQMTFETGAKRQGGYDRARERDTITERDTPYPLTALMPEPH